MNLASEDIVQHLLDFRLPFGGLTSHELLLLGFVGATWSLIHQVLGPDDPSKKK